MHSGLVQVSLGAQRLPGLDELAEKRTVALLGSPAPFALPFQIASNFTGQRMVLSRSVVPFIHSYSIADTIPVCSLPIFMASAACLLSGPNWR